MLLEMGEQKGERQGRERERKGAWRKKFGLPSEPSSSWVLLSQKSCVLAIFVKSWSWCEFYLVIIQYHIFDIAPPSRWRFMFLEYPWAQTLSYTYRSMRSLAFIYFDKRQAFCLTIENHGCTFSPYWNMVFICGWLTHNFHEDIHKMANNWHKRLETGWLYHLSLLG